MITMINFPDIFITILSGNIVRETLMRPGPFCTLSHVLWVALEKRVFSADKCTLYRQDIKHCGCSWVRISSCPSRLKSSTGSGWATCSVRFLKLPSKMRNSPATCLDLSFIPGQNSLGPGGVTQRTAEADAGGRWWAAEDIPGSCAHTLCGLIGWGRTCWQLHKDQAWLLCWLLACVLPPVLKLAIWEKSGSRGLCALWMFSALPGALLGAREGRFAPAESAVHTKDTPSMPVRCMDIGGDFRAQERIRLTLWSSQDTQHLSSLLFLVFCTLICGKCTAGTFNELIDPQEGRRERSLVKMKRAGYHWFLRTQTPLYLGLFLYLLFSFLHPSSSM